MKMIRSKILALLVLSVLCIPALVSGLMPGMVPDHGRDYANVSGGITSGSASLPHNETELSSPAPAQGSVRETSAIPPPPPGFANSSNLPPKNALVQTRVDASSHDSITDSRTGQKYVKDRVIVRFKSQKNDVLSISPEKIRRAHTNIGATVEKDLSTRGVPGLQLVQLPRGTDVQSAITAYESNPDVLYAEPDYLLSIVPDQTGSGINTVLSAHILALPNDGAFSSQWGFHNSGQTGGTPDADIDAPDAWGISTGSDSVVVAVIDTGIQYTHSDLSANIWNNSDEIPGNGIDDDGNGYVDDIRGWNFVNKTSNPIDDNSHGTHVSGTIGAVGNNTLGVVGVNWHVRIMPLKVFNRDGIGLTSDAIDAIEYANANGASVISNSWSGGPEHQGLNDTIAASPAVVVCAAGNYDSDNDVSPLYPASYSLDNIISVAATDHNDTLAVFSNFGLNSVDLAAPGKNIYSTTLGGNYAPKDGTSMATPHVSGVVALIKAVNPSLNAQQIKTIILSTVDVKPSLIGKVATGGRLNAYNALVATPPPLNANFTANTSTGTAPSTVMFTDTSPGSPSGWAWYFGDENWTESQWRQVNASAGWSGRYGHTGVSLPDGSIVLMGGYGGGIKNDVWRSTDSGATWTLVNASAGWSGRVYHSSVVMPDGSIVLMGGDDGVGIKGDVWRSIDRGTTWKQVNASAMWSGRVYHSSVAMPDGSIVLTGGFGTGGYRNDTWRSTNNGATWTQVNASGGWIAREYHSTVAMPDGSIVLMGGTDNYTLSYLNDVWRSTDNGASWLRVNASAGWSGRFLQSSVVMPDGSIVLMGGFGSDGYKNDVWRSTDNGTSWMLVNTGAGWTKRWDHQSVAMPDGSIVLIGGVDGSSYKNDVWQLMPAGSSVQNPTHTYTVPGSYKVTLQVYNTHKYTSTRKAEYINITAPVVTIIPSKIGIFRPGSGIWSLDSNGNSVWEVSDKSLSWGLPGDIQVIGDWNGDGKDEIGIFRPGSGLWSLDSNGNSAWEVSDTSLSWGLPGDLPVVGDWNGDKKDEIGIFRPTSGLWSLDSNGNYLWDVSDPSLFWGLPGDLPVVGDWNGDKKDEIGIFRPTSGLWSLDSNGNYLWDVSDTSLSWGLPNDIPVIGDWNGNGTTKIGIFRSNSGLWSLDSNGNSAWEASDTSLSWGLPGDLPIVGDWNGDKKDDIGIFRSGSGIWSLDSNGNFAWEVSDKSLSWGLPNDKPAVGRY